MVLYPPASGLIGLLVIRQGRQHLIVCPKPWLIVILSTAHVPEYKQWVATPQGTLTLAASLTFALAALWAIFRLARTPVESRPFRGHTILNREGGGT